VRSRCAVFANVSHELRTPLNSIIGFSGILARKMAGPLTSEQQTQIDMIHRSGKHLLDLVDSVLDLSKIEAGKTDIARETFDLSSLLYGVVETMHPIVDGKGLELIVNATASSEPFYSDEGKVKQILLNLLGNAVKFTNAGRVTIRFERHQDGTAVITVKDTGPGISQTNLRRIFEPFTRIYTSDGPEFKGHGLGLTLAQRYAQLLGGAITVTSKVGEGSTFTLTLPSLK